MKPPIPFAAVSGTWAYEHRFSLDEWWQPCSRFAMMLRRQGFAPIDPRPFLWTTEINGAEGWRRWLDWLPCVNKVGDQLDWYVGGEWLRRYCDPVQGQPFVVFCHSHGGQLAKFAAYQGLYIPVLVTIATPVRHLEAEIRPHVYEDILPKMRRNIGYWIHLHSGWDDKMQWLGQFGDGVVRSNRSEPHADLNIQVPANRHSRILHPDDLMDLWITEGWLDIIRKVIAEPERAA